MKIESTKIPGAYVIELSPHSDERGFFARTFCAETFRRHGMSPLVSQCNMTFTRKKGTIRGLHYQLAPAGEAKLLRCVRGAIFEVLVDMRPDSPTFLEYVGAELTQDNRRMLYIPEGCAAGCQTLTDDAEMAYHASEAYTPGVERGLRYDDPALGIEWPVPVTVVSEKDIAWPLCEVHAIRG
jgi:dTDP-4-dehydrorhamnose 3,5-epimerase